MHVEICLHNMKNVYEKEEGQPTLFTVFIYKATKTFG